MKNWWKAIGVTTVMFMSCGVAIYVFLTAPMGVSIGLLVVLAFAGIVTAIKEGYDARG